MCVCGGVGRGRKHFTRLFLMEALPLQALLPASHPLLSAWGSRGCLGSRGAGTCCSELQGFQGEVSLRLSEACTLPSPFLVGIFLANSRLRVAGPRSHPAYPSVAQAPLRWWVF